MGNKSNNILSLRRTIRGLLSEIDWADTFSDVQQKCLNPKEIVDYLNKVRANAFLDYKDREKFKKGKPFVHAKSEFFRKEDTEVDIDYFINQITTKPNSVVTKNDKMTKSGGVNEYVYNTGVPAFRGIVYNQKKGTFHLINTCPGASDCVFICYALKGNYIRYPKSYDNMTRRLNLLLNNPEQYKKQLYDEISAKAEEHKAFKGYKPKVIIRWNDSGDFFAKKYVDIVESVMDKLNEDGYNVSGYAYTKVADVAKDADFETTFSSGADKRQSKNIDLSKSKNSIIVPKEMFNDLDLMKVDDEIELKDRVSKKFNLNPNDVISYDEMKATTVLDEPRWHVLVTPDSGDDAAFRKDVKTILLTQH